MFEQSGARVLLVQSEPVLAELISLRLEMLDYQVDVVETGVQAAVSIAHGLPDVVIVDTTLGDGDGIDWIERLRGQHPPERLPIMVFSMDASLETIERAFDAGAQDFLVTPIDAAVIEDKIHTLLANRMLAARRR